MTKITVYKYQNKSCGSPRESSSPGSRIEPQPQGLRFLRRRIIIKDWLVVLSWDKPSICFVTWLSRNVRFNYHRAESGKHIGSGTSITVGKRLFFVLVLFTRLLQSPLQSCLFFQISSAPISDPSFQNRSDVLDPRVERSSCKKSINHEAHCSMSSTALLHQVLLWRPTIVNASGARNSIIDAEKRITGNPNIVGPCRNSLL